MKRLIFFITITTIIIACGSSLPKNVLPQEKMEKVLWDIAQGGEYLNSIVYYKYPAQNRAAVSNKVLDEVLKLNKITRKQLDASLEYYKDNPKALGIIFDSISAQQNRINEEAENRRKRMDSLKNAQDSLRHKPDSLGKKDSLKEKPSISNPIPVDSLKVAPFKNKIKKSATKKKKKRKAKPKPKTVPVVMQNKSIN